MAQLLRFDGVMAWAEEHARAHPERFLCPSNVSLGCLVARYFAERLDQDVDDSGMGVDGWVKPVGDKASWFRDEGFVEVWVRFDGDYEALMEYLDRLGPPCMTAHKARKLLGRFLASRAQ